MGMSGHARIEIGAGATRHYDAAGRLVSEVLWPYLDAAPASDGCGCCEHVPAGTIDRAVALLGDDRPDVAALLLEARR